MSESNAVATRQPKGLKDSLAAYREAVQRVAAKGVTADFILTSALLTVNASPDLQKCSVASIGQSITRIAQWGLIPGSTAHLVPFGTTCTAVADYKGLIQLMRECGARDVDAQVVREGDVFEWELGLQPLLRHVPNHTRGKIVAAYCIVRLPHGVPKVEVMDAAEIDALRKKHSKQWKNGELPEWYARKTVIRRAAKFTPMFSAKLSAVLAQDGESPEADEIIPAGEITPIALELPRRAPTHSPLDLSAMEEEFGATKVTVVGRPAPVSTVWADIPDSEVFDPT